MLGPAVLEDDRVALAGLGHVEADLAHVDEEMAHARHVGEVGRERLGEGGNRHGGAA